MKLNDSIFANFQDTDGQFLCNSKNPVARFRFAGLPKGAQEACKMIARYAAGDEYCTREDGGFEPPLPIDPKERVCFIEALEAAGLDWAEYERDQDEWYMENCEDYARNKLEEAI